MLPTVGDTLALDAVRSGQPQVLAGRDRLDTPVRWVHVSELVDIAPLLRGGELVLTTGIALPDERERLERYVAELAGVGASGVIVELGRKYASTPPGTLVRAAEHQGLPLIALHRETPFVRITEAVHARIIDTQLSELRASEQVHRTFTELSVEGAEPAEVVREAGRLGSCPAVLENLAHQVLACDPADANPEDLLDAWEVRSRSVQHGTRTTYDPTTGWLLTMVGARGQDWGRLILICGKQPSSRHIALVEQAAAALALSRLAERQRESLERQTHRTIISGILNHAYADPEEAAARARAVGVSFTGRRLLGVVLRLDGSGEARGLAGQERLAEFAETAARACRETELPALIGSLDEVRVGVLLALPTRADEERSLSALAAALRGLGGRDFVMGVGAAMTAVRDARRSLVEAWQVADVAAQQRDDPDGKPYYRVPDLRLRGLLHVLRDDARLQSFVERELGDLLAHDARHGTALLRVLTAYLEQGGNKAAAAKAAHLSRPVLYERLHAIERITGVALDDPQSRLSLHVALLALGSVRDATR